MTKPDRIPGFEDHSSSTRLRSAVAHWGDAPVNESQVSEFADHLDVTRSDRLRVVNTLLEFPTECQVRGMFFRGLVDVIDREVGRKRTGELLELAAVPSRMIPFSLLPHRDFYKMYFLAANRFHPRDSLARGMRQIAETFYPVFKSSRVGRTMSLLMGSTPEAVLGRLAEAYNLSIPWNRHSVEFAGSSARWTAFVEPSAHYRETFTGIVSGTMTAHRLPTPVVEHLGSAPRDGGFEHEFRVSW